MTSATQHPTGTCALEAGLLLQCKRPRNTPPWRITHVFKKTIHVVTYGTPSEARTAHKPHPISRAQVEADLRSGASVLCTEDLPEQLFRTMFSVSPSTPKTSSSSHDSTSATDIVYGWIEPLLKDFEIEENLAPSRFNALISHRATALHMSAFTVRRLVIRYYYFGRVKEALIPLVPGPQPKGGPQCARTRPLSRAGRQPREAKIYGRNKFVLDQTDVDDMINRVRLCGRRHSDLVTAHEEYLKLDFSKRHPSVYKAYLAEQHPVPVTYMQFWRWVKAYRDFSAEVIENIPALASTSPGKSSHSSGPGEVYEADASALRVELVHKDPSGEDVRLGKPWIYLMIDRWSRYIVSVYVTFGAPSWEELKYLLLIAFGPRADRFRCLGIEIDEARWPRARIPSVVDRDRGSDFSADSTIKANVEELRMEWRALPPQCADAKGVVERVFRDLKKYMYSTGVKGVYAMRPTSPKTKREAKTAQKTATATLQQIYRIVLKYVDQHNNSPHSALEKNLQLAQAGVPPTPVAAYLWGCKNLTGVKLCSLSEKTLMRKLLSVGKGSISNSQVKFEGLHFDPVDAAAHTLAATSTGRPHKVDIRFDKTFRQEIYVVSPTGKWSRWRLIESDRTLIHGITREEEPYYREVAALQTAVAGNRSRIGRLKQGREKSSARKQPARSASQEETRARRKAEMDRVKSGITKRRSPAKRKTATNTTNVLDWRKLEAEERQKTINRTRERISS